MDLPDAKDRLKDFRKRYKKIEILPISAQGGEGIDALKTRIGTLVLGDEKREA
jgi:selenocysteine-specific translation elongation factor